MKKCLALALGIALALTGCAGQAVGDASGTASVPEEASAGASAQEAPAPPATPAEADSQPAVSERPDDADEPQTINLDEPWVGEEAPEEGGIHELPDWPALYDSDFTPEEILHLLWWRANRMYAGGEGYTIGDAPEATREYASTYYRCFIDYEATTGMVFTPNALAQYESYAHGEPLIFKDEDGKVYVADYPMTIINVASVPYEAELLEETSDTRRYKMLLENVYGGEPIVYEIGLRLTSTGWLVDDYDYMKKADLK